MTGADLQFHPANLSMALPHETKPKDHHSDDHRLMACIAKGDEAAFRQLVEKHQAAVVGTAAKMLGDSVDAEDIAQQVFLRVWKHAKRYRPKAKFTTYLFTITRNLVFNESRRRSRRNEISADAMQDDSGRMPEEQAEKQPDEEILQQELHEAIDKAIQALPEKQRLAVVLRRYEELPYEEIGKVLDLSIPAVKSLLFRARTSLREQLARFLDDAG